MTARTQIHRLQVATSLYRFIEDSVLPGTGVSSTAFWQGFDAVVHDLSPKNVALLAERDRIQTAMDSWHRAHPGPLQDMAGYSPGLNRLCQPRAKQLRHHGLILVLFGLIPCASNVRAP